MVSLTEMPTSRFAQRNSANLGVLRGGSGNDLHKPVTVNQCGLKEVTRAQLVRVGRDHLGRCPHAADEQPEVWRS